MKRASILIAVAAMTLLASDVFAQTNDHFARQRREAAARRVDAKQDRGGIPWGGPTTSHRWHPRRGGHGHTVIHRQIQVVPVHPFGYGFPIYRYGVRHPYFGPVYGFPVGQHIHIHREIHR